MLVEGLGKMMGGESSGANSIPATPPDDGDCDERGSIAMEGKNTWNIEKNLP
ncbi:hypothetical protein JGC56_02835 [Salmonella enterica subsp. enterica serovar Saintpaul]|nr:hypothetical protein [Salmonella enterica subsp. enterica serovar Saintpaul]